MGSLFVGAVEGLVRFAGLVGEGTPYVPSTPVQIGTSGPHQSPAQIGSWRDLLLMFAAVIVIGTAVLLYVVRQRARLLERRRLRRMAEAAALVSGTDASTDHPQTLTAAAPTPPLTAPTAPTKPATPSGAAPNA